MEVLRLRNLQMQKHNTLLFLNFNLLPLFFVLVADLQWGNIECNPEENTWTSWRSLDHPTATGDWELVDVDECENPGVQVYAEIF